MSEYTAKRARTRGQILAAGQEMLPGALRRGLDYALSPGLVAQRAGLSRQTWYRYWRADDSGFLDELTGTAVASVDLLLQPALEQLPAELTLREAAGMHFEIVTQRRVALVRLLVATLAVEDQFLEAEAGTRPTAATTVLRDHYQRLRGVLARLYAPALATAGRRPRPPLDLAGLLDGLGVVADGFALRHAAAPAPSDRAGFIALVEVAVAAATEAVPTDLVGTS